MQLQSLAEQLKISELEIEERKRLLGLKPEHLEILRDCEKLILPQLGAIIDEFYAGQLEIPGVRISVGDKDTLARLKSSMRDYVATVFGGDYGPRYINSRLRIGKVHARIGVQPKLYLASLHQLANILMERLSPAEPNPLLRAALHKIFLFDLVLVFDTYIQSLVDEVTLAKDEMADYARNLEQIVEERTASLKKLAETDELTGLKNRRALIATLTEEIAQIHASETPLAVAFVDVNKFKEVNDKYGHQAGDEVLKHIASAFRASVADPERVFRYGGDEFVAVFPASELRKEKECAAHLKTTIEEHLEGKASVSVGVTHFCKEDPISLETILKSIDAQMYQSKLADTPEEDRKAA